MDRAHDVWETDRLVVENRVEVVRVQEPEWDHPEWETHLQVNYLNGPGGTPGAYMEWTTVYRLKERGYTKVAEGVR